ncbi:glycosyltransferase family 4 protein [Caulobacter sp. 17J65-9]|uniref:glycosyltransferase family 4 protein n=1 Tax=Caulobacter sp. 17J65-9 TaxID=2709382 RepID=UPI0013CD028D|nr:glycosyltransferase family 4 protein [Caulobacter sp. 17J65-9]NEX93559.1 glycosyltransferase family 4 protein [Caulobacter sp. 17J65-9]
MNILHVMLADGFGGTERYLADLARRQIALGDTVGAVVKPRAPRAPASFHDHAPDGLRIFETSRLFTPLAILRAARALKADVVHAHGGRTSKVVASTPLLPPTVGTLHIKYRRAESGGLGGVIRVAEWQAAAMGGFKGLSVTVPNWLPSLADCTPDEVARARRAADAKRGPLLVFVGRLTPVKGVDLLIAAFRAIAPAHARLAVVGDGPQRPDLEALAAGDGRITFAGHVRNPSAWYEAADHLVMPSRAEPFGLVALEAMARGVPITATRTGGLSEILSGTPARLVPPGDDGELARALAETFTAMSKGTFPRRVAYDLSRYDADRAVARIERFYRDVVGQRQPAGQAPAPAPVSV